MRVSRKTVQEGKRMYEETVLMCSKNLALEPLALRAVSHLASRMSQTVWNAKAEMKRSGEQCSGSRKRNEETRGCGGT